MKVLEKIPLIRQQLPIILEEVLVKYEKQIVELQKAQLGMGLNSDGQIIGQYSQATIRRREEEGRPVKGKNIALYDYGNFWDGIFAESSGGVLNISSTDEKTEMLIEDYTEKIFGLNNTSIKWLREKIIGDIRKELYRWLKT